MIREENINCSIEALIMASPEPVPMKRLCEVLDDVSPVRVRQAVDDLNNVYLGCGSSFRIREVAGGYQIYILPDFEGAVKKLLTKQRTIRLTRAALEVLAIIAYKQPVPKTDIEHIRGVASDGVLHNLLERKLIVIAGRSEGPGRALLYRTSLEFLKFFGLNRLSDLPRMEEIEEMIRQAETPTDQTELPFANDGNGHHDEPADEFQIAAGDEMLETDSVAVGGKMTFEMASAEASLLAGGNGDMDHEPQLIGGKLSGMGLTDDADLDTTELMQDLSNDTASDLQPDTTETDGEISSEQSDDSQ
jgi:segregation and condensation protein B